jgi:hypothetical protein
LANSATVTSLFAVATSWRTAIAQVLLAGAAASQITLSLASSSFAFLYPASRLFHAGSESSQLLY